VKSEKQTVYQQNSVIAQTVKDPPQNYVINLPDNEISGGYINTSPNDQFSMTNNSASPIGGQTPATNADKLASIKQVTQNPANLALIIVAIVFGAGFLGLLLIKFRKRSLPRA
jgi:hypothetical protein